MTKYDFIRSLTLEELTYFLATTKIGIVKGVTKRLGYEIGVTEEMQEALVKDTKKFLESEVLTND